MTAGPTSTSATGGSGGTDTTSSSSGGNTTSDPSGGNTTDDTGGGSTGGSVFVGMPDGGGSGKECDLWTQDCPMGEKCMPWANDGGNSWNASKCVPVDENPGQPGDACSVEGSDVSGIDTCAAGSMCWDVDAETQMGTCISFCEGDAANPQCSDSGTFCNILNDGVLILCLPSCDPIAQDCPNENLCIPTVDATGFSCWLDASGDMGAYGDPCEYINVCDPGLFCAIPDGVPGCQGSIGCCSEFCDLTDANATANCAGSADGQECVAWFEDGQAPPGLDHVGVCIVPI